MAALNNLDVLSGDIHNALLEASTKENILFCAGDKCKSDKDNVFIFVRALNALKYSALYLRNCLDGTLCNRLG